ncbi:MAG TPA: DUF4450 domain-containing protein [Candidatus Hydrogenedentes bacterium]|nr:DUF4450 domain-containing protein [Candidatus Hydrogenedentota bacterium]HOS02982.1 DUF4450 domain-containing protein [Candidatus Hydrogenedentota bacterium]
MSDPANCYVPVKGGWRIRIAADDQKRPGAGEAREAVGNPRLHRRPLFPPADRALLWREDQLRPLVRGSFRPIVLAHGEPRFLFDMHAAGGLAGHLYVGLVSGDQGKWLHDFSGLTTSYVDGCMIYEAIDPAFPGVSVELKALALADAIGAVLRIVVDGAAPGAELIWGYGGANSFCTNYDLDAPEFAYSPEHCAKDVIRTKGGRFTLRRAFDASDSYLNQPASTLYAAGRILPEWTLEMCGGSSWKARCGLGAPGAFSVSPADTAASTAWTDGSGERRNCVAVQRVSLEDGVGYIAVGAGFTIEAVLDDLDAAWDAAVARSQSIANRIVLKTPDPWLDAAAPMVAFSTEGTWGDASIVHGGWTWRQSFLGWRTWYGPTCYGWQDRIRKAIRNHAALSRITEGDDAGALGHQLEDDKPWVWYNMNEVFLDKVRHYFDYTNDLNLMRDLFPVLEGIIEWENRRLAPGDGSLYESSLNIWMSDCHWHRRAECTQASAYMLRAHEFMADLALRLGYDPAPWTAQAARIRAAMQERLWQEDAGVFAECLDTLGYRMLHPEPEAPTIYHAIEFGAADAKQVSRMLRWVDANLWCEEKTPGGGQLVWSSTWHPGHGPSFSWCIREVAPEENFNLAIAYWAAARPDEAYALLRGPMCGMYDGPVPGGLPGGCHPDGRQRHSPEFADSSSLWGRVVCEGLFGIVPRKQDGIVHLSPQFPRGWPEASIKGPHFAYTWRRATQSEGRRCVQIDWEAPDDAVVRLRMPIPAEDAASVRADGAVVPHRMDPGYDGLNWVCAESTRGRSGSFEIEYAPVHIEPAAWPAPRTQPRPGRVWQAPACAASSDRALTPWALIDVSARYNASVPDVPQHIVDRAEPPVPPESGVAHRYWRVDHVGQLLHGQQQQGPSDAAWRAKIGDDGVAWTTDGIPFKSVRDGDNIAVVTLEGAGFPKALDFPVNAQGAALFLMISGMTFAMQSHVVNVRATLNYADGEAESFDLVNPFGIGDCWSTWCGRFHDTAANGFENIGGRKGPAGSAEVDDMTQPVEVDTEAHLVRFDLQPDVELASFRFEAIANDVVFGVMGATVLK